LRGYQIPPPPPDGFVTIPQACRQLGIGRTKLYELFDANQLRRQHDGHQLVVAVDELESFKRRSLSADNPLVRRIVAQMVVAAYLSPQRTDRALIRLCNSLASAARGLSHQ
jgi:hypothetical protein